MKKEDFEQILSDKLEEKTNEIVEKVKAELKVDEEPAEDNKKAVIADGKDLAEDKPFKSFGEFLIAVNNAERSFRKADPRLRKLFVSEDGKTAGHMAEGEDSQGGFLVADQYQPKLLEIALEESVIRPNKPTVIPMTSDTLLIPRVVDTSHASSVFGGVLAYWTEEAGAKTPTKAAFGQCKLTAHKLCGLTYASNELLADSAIALEPLLMRQFASALAFYEDDAFINGNGVGQPLGILNCACLATPSRTTGSHVYSFDLANMWAALLPASRKRAIWLINQEVLPELLELSDIGAAPAAGTNLVWMGRYTDEPTMTIFGRPVFITEKCQALGTQGDIILADLAYYLVGDRQKITIDSSIHVAFTTDETCWRFVLRVDGQCWPSSAVTPMHGSQTLSPFVVLG